MPTSQPRRFVIVLFLMALSIAIHACAETNTIQYEGRAYQIPIPEGFEILPSEGRKLQNIIQGSIGTNGVLLTTLVSTEDARGLRAGRFEDVERSLVVVGFRNAMKDIQTDDLFMRLQAVMLKKYEEKKAKVRDSIQQSELKVNDLVWKEFNGDKGFKLGNMTLYPIHSQSRRHWAESMAIGLEMTNALGGRETATNFLTTTYLFFRPGVLQLGASFTGGDLDWTRRAGQEWMEMVAAANPLAEASSVSQVIPTPDAAEKSLNALDTLYDDSLRSFFKWIALFLVVAISFLVRKGRSAAPKRDQGQKPS